MTRFVSLISLILLFLVASEAREIVVGGNESKTFWSVPDGNRSDLNYWAEDIRFRKGDVLVWKSVGKKDSVLEVNKAGYRNCNTTDPIQEVDGEVTLDRSGHFYFISGAHNHCKKGEKLEVVVLSAPAPAPTSGSSNVVGGSGLAAVVALAMLFL